MAYRNLHFTSLAKDLRTETYNGEEHLVVPCVALVGDEVVYGMNAEGPEFIPAEELEYSTLGWSGRPVLPDHPANSTSTANDPRTLELMQFGQIFYPKFEDGRLKVEAWLGRDRAKEVEGAEDIIARIESGDVIELSVGAIISLEKRNGISPSGKKFQAVWHDVQSDHLAIGLSGSEGACNIEMGCGANRVLKSANVTEPENGVRMMRAIRETSNMSTATAPSTAPKTAKQPEKVIARSAAQKILSFASRAFRSNVEDEGLGDNDLRNKLWDLLYAVEPAFHGIEEVFQQSGTVTFITSPDGRMHMWRRTFVIGESDSVSLGSEERELLAVSNYHYIYLGENPTAVVAAEATKSEPCGCHKSLSDTTDSSANDNATNSTEEPNMADASNTTTTTPAPDADKNKITPPTPEKGSSEAGTPSQSGSEDKTIPNYPAGQTTPSDTVPPVTNEQLKALLEAHPVVKHYRAQEAKERSGLVAALVKSQKVLSKEQLEAKSIEDLRTIAELVGVNTAAPAADYSGRMLVNPSDNELPPPPDPHGVNKFLRKESAN